MKKKEFEEKLGVVVEALPAGKFRVKLDDEDREVIGYLSGKMRRYRIYILLGDKVRLEFSKYDDNMGRITFRFK